MERGIARAGQERDPSYQFRYRLAAREAQGHPLALQDTRITGINKARAPERKQDEDRDNGNRGTDRRGDWRNLLVRWCGSGARSSSRSEEHTSELQSLRHLVCRLLLEKKKNNR